ncbi:MAG: YfhO family protein, partial [Litorilinea sp.]
GQGQDIHVALDHIQPLDFLLPFTGLVQAVQFPALVEDGRFRGIEIFGFAVINDAAAETDGAAALAELAHPDFDPTTAAVVEIDTGAENTGTGDTGGVGDGVDLPPALLQAGGASDGVSDSPGDGVTLLTYAAEAVTLHVQTAQPAALVLSDVYYPGWRAWIDATETPVYRANHLFRAIVVPPGEHTVTFRFEPDTFYGGLWWSGLGLVLIVALLGLRGAVSKRPQPVRLPSAPDV